MLLSAARSEVEQAKADLEKSKAEFVQLIADTKASAIAKNLDPDVKVTWITYGPRGQYGVKDNTTIPITFGFREDRIMIWKYADE